jgi:hypothetical protein
MPAWPRDGGDWPAGDGFRVGQGENRCLADIPVPAPTDARGPGSRDSIQQYDHSDRCKGGAV